MLHRLTGETGKQCKLRHPEDREASSEIGVGEMRLLSAQIDVTIA
jgi:hypothetical protein